MKHGQGLAEYALLVALVAVVVIVAVLWFGRELTQMIDAIGSTLCGRTHLCTPR